MLLMGICSLITKGNMFLIYPHLSKTVCSTAVLLKGINSQVSGSQQTHNA